MKKILLFSRDPGGANTLIPLVKKLEKKYEVRLYGKDMALKRYNYFNLEGLDIENRVKEINLAEIKNFLKNEKPDYIITGTSADDRTEKILWEAAKKLNIKSLAIIDNWMNYGVRFSKYGVSEISKYEKSPEHEYQPDKILVMDSYTKKEMEKIGFAKNKLIVSGQPYFDLLDNYQKKYTKNKVAKFKKENEISLKDKLVTFASEPLEFVYKEAGKKNTYFGFTEKTIIKDLLGELRKIVSENKKINLTLVLKLHPKENESEIMKLVESEKDLNFKIKILKDCNSWDLMMSSDLICGMSSMFLIESVILNRPVISIKIGLRKEDTFILSRRKILKTVLNKKQLKKKLEKALILKENPKYNFKVIKAASDNIIKFIDKSLCQN